MAVIKSGSSVDELTVDAVNKAARVAVYDTEGNPVDAVLPRFSVAVHVSRFSAIIGALGYVYSFVNGNTKKVKFDTMIFEAMFDGTAAASTQLFEVIRTTSGTPTGGSALTLPADICKRRSPDANSSVASITANNAAALVTSGVSFQSGEICSFGVPRSVTGKSELYDFSSLEIELQPGEGILIRATNAVVVGDGIHGSLGWSEKV